MIHTSLLATDRHRTVPSRYRQHDKFYVSYVTMHSGILNLTSLLKNSRFITYVIIN